ncbi:MAG: TIR domain-containing protein [Myxococcales bacterium]|nr:TIR domain-containing protein [Myxococcales bacterium]
MSKQVFVSHVYEDRNWIEQLRDWARTGQLGHDVEISTELEDVRAQGDAEVDARLLPRVRGAAIVLVLVGENTHDRRWITREIEMANSLHKRIVVTQLPGTHGAPPPSASKYPLVSWNPPALRLAFGA